ncbi:MAG: metallophosphoesterase [Desulfobacterales bacterium]|nr:MAG: metallophosphoesterase [Desulfobacterales bacterium]
MKTIAKKSKPMTFKVFLLAAVIVVSGCATTPFHYDRAALSGAKPWTSEAFKNNLEEFQFAVVGDRTGGSNPEGIFTRAMDQLNLLQPEFVISVGDLVEGYTEDRAKAAAEWDEVDGIIKTLEMPFFYVPGNHDLGNDAMKQVWLERRGATYYHFIYRDVLFLVFNSEDPSHPPPEGMAERTATYKRLLKENPAAAQKMLEEFMANLESYKKPMLMSDQQINYFRKVLAENPKVRWTFAFFHQPDWEQKQAGEAFQAIEQMLRGRPHTVIAGHLHYYDYKKRNGTDYITMGPVGASWHMNGPGNVDHILWVTMKQGGPEIAMITLDGVWDRKGRDLKLKETYERTAETEGLYQEP